MHHQTDVGASVRQGRLTRRSSWVGAVKLLGIIAVVAVTSATSIAAITVGSLGSSVHTVRIGAADKTGAEPLRGAVDFVVVGSDTRQGQTAAAEVDSGT